jgi:hypothetical protein
MIHASSSSSSSSSSPHHHRPSSSDNFPPLLNNQVSSEAAADAIEGPLRDIVARDRIRIKNFFADYDHMRSGKCTEAQFMRALKVSTLFYLYLMLLSHLYDNIGSHPVKGREYVYAALRDVVAA